MEYKKSQKYEDRKSSAFSFVLIGGLLTIFSILLWSQVISLPVDGFSKYMFQFTMTLMGIGCLIIAFNTLKTAKKLAGEIHEEKMQTDELLEWFLDFHKGIDLDNKLDKEFPGLTNDERNLKRFELIQDILITNKDLPDQAYVEALSEEIYVKLFES